MIHRTLSTVYHRLPRRVQSPVRNAYFSVRSLDDPKREEERIRNGFVDDFFESEAEYESFLQEFRKGPASDIRSEATERYFEQFDYSFGDVGVEVGARYYALIRKLQPDRIIETGVCNGFSTLALLLALNENKNGHLTSIDFPRYADQSVEEYLNAREVTLDVDNPKVWVAPRIPKGEEPGWIIPDSLRDRWTLQIGLSQEELPRELAENGKMDLFLHDSDHSMTGMLFEWDLAWNWLRDDGVLVSDDIHHHTAFEQFIADRNPAYGRLRKDVGYFIK